MSTCPVCESPQVLIAVSLLGSAACRECGARWTKEDLLLATAEPSTIPNVVGVIRPDATELTASVTQIDPRA